MNEIYRAVHTTRQNFHQRLDAWLQQQEEQAQVRKIMHQVRQDHPAMGAETMYQLLRPCQVGRDRFRQLYNESGFKLYQRKNYRRTTDSSGTQRFDNLVAGRELISINQAWSSDITYYQIADRFYYLTFIMDLYSRRITGYSISTTLLTEATTIPALQRALEPLGNSQSRGLIFHSDGGGQYYSKTFLSITHKAGIQNSMGTTVYENAHAERLNGTIKNSYLRHYAPTNLKELERLTKKAVQNYNTERPHQALRGLCPVAFEQLCHSNPQLHPISTKKKVAKKKTDNHNNHITKPTHKTVNLIQ